MTVLLAFIRRYWLSITLFTLTVITILSLSPLEELPPVPGQDKTHHFIAYAALMFPSALRKQKPKSTILITLFFIACSGAIELIQPYVNRYGEWLDLIANIAGLGCGFLLAQSTKWIFPLNSK
jgi:VanZ family protein